MKLIPLTQGQFAQVDDEDFERVNQFRWYAVRSGNGRKYYAARVDPNSSKRSVIKMHVFIMGDNPLKMPIDHIDSNGINNQRRNLRFCTPSENARNRTREIGCTSIYKGVHWYRHCNRWVATIWANNKHAHVKYFIVEVDAARQYDIWAKELFGEFAVLNFPI